MKKSCKFRIYPNKNQEVKLNRTLATCRHLYNDCLEERKRQAELNRLKKDFDVFPWGKPEWVNYYEQKRELAVTKTLFQKDVYSQVLQDVIKRVDRSFKNFFNGFGYPRFQGRNRYNSFTYPQSGFGLEDGKLNLSKIGNIKIIQHREIEPPKFLRKSEGKLTLEQKQLSRKRKGSGKRNKQRIIVSKTHRKIRNQRTDFAHKMSRMLVNNYDLIKFEDLQIKNMVRNHHLAKSISDAGWNQLMNFTKFKAECAGKVVEFVNPAGTSQTCICGYPVPKDLSMRIHRCPQCGLVMKRDRVSAILIENRPSTVGTTGINARQGLLNRGSMQRDAPWL